MPQADAVTEDRRFLAWFAVLLSMLSFAYIFLVTLIPPVTSSGQHYADVILGFLLGTVISGVTGFFYGASKQQPGPVPTVAGLPPPAVTIDIPAEPKPEIKPEVTT